MVYGANGSWRWRNPLAALLGRTRAMRRGRSAPRSAASDREPDRTPFETKPSPVAYALYACTPGRSPTADHRTAFGFPDTPVAAGTDATGSLFDTTAATVDEARQRIHYHLRFGGRTHPYWLVHEGAGTYTSRGAEMDFRWGDEEQFQVLDAHLTRGEPYHVTVRDVVQLEEPGGRFDWSVSRTDIADGRSDAPAVSLIVVVWRIGRPGQDPAECRRGTPSVGGAASGPLVFPDDQTRSVRDQSIAETAVGLIDAGHGTHYAY